MPIRDTLLIASFHVPRWHFGSGYVFSVCDTDFCEEKGVSRHETWPDDKKTVRDTRFHGEKGVSRHEEHACTPQRYDKLPNPARDTDFCEGKGVSRHETRPDDRKTVRDTQFNAKKGVSRQGKVVGKRTATGKSRVLRSRSGSGRG